MKLFLILLIRLYQLCLSPFVGQCCRFAPSCSEYAKEALETHGVLKGIWLALKRVSKCGPWHPGGYDPVKRVDKIDFLYNPIYVPVSVPVPVPDLRNRARARSRARKLFKKSIF